MEAKHEALGVMLLLVAWYAASAATRGFLPPPHAVAAAFLDPGFDAELARAYMLTAVRALTGYALGLAAGLGLGVLAAAARLHRVLEPVAAIVASVPSVAWIPILIALVGVDEFRLPVLAALLCSLPPILYEVFNAVSTLDPETVGVAMSLGARGAYLWRTIILPHILERVYPGAKIEAIMAWKTVFAAEMIAVPSGLGYLAITYADMLDMKHLLAVIAVLTATIAALVRLLGILEERMLAERGLGVWSYAHGY